MSNCHVAAGRSLIDLVASRLALRAPALRAASALTRPNQSAQWLPSGRHRVPTVKMVGPNDVITNHRIEHSDHLVHDRNDHDFAILPAPLRRVRNALSTGFQLPALIAAMYSAWRTGARPPQMQRLPLNLPLSNA